MSRSPHLRVEEVRFFERHIRLRMPFRFGVVTLTEAPQVFVRARIRLADGTPATGQSAELLAPKWFDKDPDLSNAENFDQLRAALGIARRLVLEQNAGRTAFGLHAAVAPRQYSACAQAGLNGLVAGFGTALIDRAVLDALCRAQEMPVFEAVRRNLPGIDATTTPDLAGFDLDAFLAGLHPSPSIDARHTVGLVDPITEDDIASDARVDDGLPQSLESVIAAYGHRYFKLKVGGEVRADVDRLNRIAAVLDRSAARYFVSLDGNEQFGDADAVIDLLRHMAQVPELHRLVEAILYVEQPIGRTRALERPIHALAALKPVAIDESDADIGVFPRARALGYAGMSSKSCKGFYRALLNRARTALWNAEGSGGPYFMTAEDLTTQAGIALQQDLALATLIGCSHSERNGHHYVDGMAGAPPDEQARFRAAHPDLYHDRGGGTRLGIRDGRLAIGSLAALGLGTAVEPDWTAMDERHYGG